MIRLPGETVTGRKCVINYEEPVLHMAVFLYIIIIIIILLIIRVIKVNFKIYE
jgi:hypothetical protein